jgi:hypothetical protein
LDYLPNSCEKCECAAFVGDDPLFAERFSSCRNNNTNSTPTVNQGPTNAAAAAAAVAAKKVRFWCARELTEIVVFVVQVAYEPEEVNLHRIRITLTSTNVINLEKGDAMLARDLSRV